jgi:DNA repair protein RadA/Sms
MKIVDPSIDAGVCVAIASSLRNVNVEPDVLIIGEVGLAGEIRGVSQAEKRVKEAAALGFKKIVLPDSNKKGIKSLDVELLGVTNLDEILFHTLGW